MKNLILILLVTLGLNLQAQEAKRYALKSGYIKYELSGSTKGTKELWWDDYGRKTCEVEKSTTTTKMFGIKNTEEKNTSTVLIKDKYWVADYIQNSGSTGTVPYYNEGQEFVNEMTEEEQKEFADEILAQMGGKKEGTENLNGYSCDVIKVMGIKSWIHKGLVLKTEGKILGVETNEMFVEFKPNSNVSASRFNPPSGVKFEDLSSVTGGFMGALGAFDEEMDEEENEETIAIDYSFDKFKKIVNACNIEGYRCVAVNSFEGMHSASFMKGMNSVMVIAQSDKNMDKDEDLNSFDSFRHNGHTCHFGEEEEENGSALIVEYPSDDMIVTIMAIPGKSKDELLKIDDKLQF
ncbi:hypothetical protein [uncultured Draconibacterium sp.]|uniref:hypothetical protein n=1 Tax=uncultured Draconibacterium sp. TaxID=1573823 RepID=UPI0032172146